MTNISVGERLRDLRADLVIEVITPDDGGDPVRGCRAIEMLIEICTKLSRALLPGSPPSLRPVAIVEDIDSHSVIAWLRLEQGLEQPGAQEAIEYVNGSILESAKWLSNCGPGVDFQRLLASLEALRGKSSRAPQPEAANLLRALCELQEVRTSLSTRDQLLLVTERGAVRLDRSSLIPASHLLRSAAKWHLKNDATEMLLVVRAPDYSGGNVWSAQHNGASVEVNIHDRGWLDAFTKREIDVREGDVLRVVATTEQHYAADGTLLDAEIRITSVRETTAKKLAAPAATARTELVRPAPPKSAPASSPLSINLSYSGRKTEYSLDMNGPSQCPRT